MNILRNLLFIVSTLFFASCAAIDNAMKSPVGAVSTYVAVTDDTSQDVMPLRSIDDKGHIVPKGQMGAFKQPLFYAYDISNLETGDFAALTKKATYDSQEHFRDDLIEKIIYQSDKNFEQYSRRVLALDRGTSFTQKMIDSLSTATIGGTALFFLDQLQRLSGG
jgi:hypothetical protein